MSSDRFEIPCPGCGTQVAVSMAHVGKKGRCPQCKTVFPIVAPAPAPSLGLQPIRSGLQPIGSPGLQPIGAPAQPMPPGLKPIGGSRSQPAPAPAPGLQP